MIPKRFVSMAYLLLTIVVFCSGAWAQSQLVPLSHSAPTLTLFQSEQQAQTHCPQDTVVWLNLASGVYHFKGQRWYRSTNNGAFVCENEADKTGSRATRNGQ